MIRVESEKCGGKCGLMDGWDGMGRDGFSEKQAPWVEGKRETEREMKGIKTK